MKTALGLASAVHIGAFDVDTALDRGVIAADALERDGVLAIGGKRVCDASRRSRDAA